MTTIYEFLLNNESAAKGHSMKLFKIISDYHEKYAPEGHKDDLLVQLAGAILECHYDKLFAEWQVQQMFFMRPDGSRGVAPYPLDMVDELYKLVSKRLKYTYNKYDVYVTWNMLYTDNINMYKEWWPEASEQDLLSKITDATVNWLNDDDYSSCKIWRYFNK